MMLRTVSGPEFLWLVLQHALPKALSTGAQFRLSASELQTPDRLAASVAQIHPDAGE
ncbi:MAG: hypothetical protein IPL70_06625 [Uliginosibacterium sp.]|nr:hypothetical protein [Uliginosibacterium sp.]